MNSTNAFLDAIKSRHGIASDYALCKMLGVTSSRVGNYRKNRSVFDDFMAVKVAELLEIDPMYVIACVHNETAKRDEEKALWRSMVKKLGGVAASVVIGFSALPSPSVAHAETSLSFNDNIHYAH